MRSRDRKYTVAPNQGDLFFLFSLDVSVQSFLQYLRHIQHVLSVQVPTVEISIPTKLQETTALHEADTYSNNHDAVVQESKSNERECVVQQNCEITNTNNKSLIDKINRDYADCV